MRSTDLLLAITDLVDVTGQEGTDAIHDFSKTAQKGLSPIEIQAVIELVLHSTTLATHKNILVSECLIPDGKHLLPREIVGRVLATVGTPEIYYKNGKQHKLKRLQVTTIQRLLEWLVCVLPAFGKPVFAYLRRFLPMLFGLLPYEFLRPYIATLIVVATSSTDAALRITSKNTVRQWHVLLVTDLAEQFPSDPVLKPLLSFLKFKVRTPNVSDSGNMRSAGDLDGMITNEQLHAVILTKFELSSMEREVTEVEKQLRRLFTSLGSRGLKRRRVGPQFDIVSHSDHVLILSVSTVSSLIAQFEKIDLPNPSSVLSLTTAANNRHRRLYLALYLAVASQNDQITKKLKHAIQSHILGDNNNSVHTFPQLLEFGRFQGLKSLTEPLKKFINSGEGDLAKKIRLVRYLPWEKSALVSAIVKIASQVGKDNLDETGELFEEISFLIEKWRVVFANGDTYHEFLSCVLDIVFHTFALAEQLWTKFSLQHKIRFVQVLKAVKNIESVHSWGTAGLLVPPPTLMCLMVISTHPLILSEALGYLAFLKSLPIPESDQKTIALRNKYVMDSINFVWRDMALKKEANTFSQGMFLDDEFLQKVSALNFFSYSNFIQLKTVGGVVQNPSLVYICAELVWKLEDQADHITTRHPGPISEESVAQLHQDTDNTWLSMSYYDIKISLLNSLDELGYTGLCDFLFSSLKSLENQRAKKS